MSTYNADPNPDVNKIRQVAFGYQLSPLSKLKVDQLSTDTSNKVYSMVVKLGKTRLKFLVDPSLIPS